MNLNDFAHAGKQVFPRGASKPDHRTPIDLFKTLSDEVGGFDLDAAASVENHLCEFYFTQQDDGLSQHWGEGRVWCNPPYSNWGQWAEKAFNQVRHGSTQEVWLLLPARTDTKAFHQYVWGRASEIRFVKGRLNFTGPHALSGSKASAPFPSVLVRYTKSSGFNQALISTCDKQGRPHKCKPGQHESKHWVWGDL